MWALGRRSRGSCSVRCPAPAIRGPKLVKSSMASRPQEDRHELHSLFGVWAVIAAATITLLIYRAVVGAHEDESLHVGRWRSPPHCRTAGDVQKARRD